MHGSSDPTESRPREHRRNRRRSGGTVRRRVRASSCSPVSRRSDARSARGPRPPRSGSPPPPPRSAPSALVEIGVAAAGLADRRLRPRPPSRSSTPRSHSRPGGSSCRSPGTACGCLGASDAPVTAVARRGERRGGGRGRCSRSRRARRCRRSAAACGRGSRSCCSSAAARALVATGARHAPALNAAVREGGSAMTALVVIETVVLVLLTVVVIGLLRSHGEILQQLHALGAGLDPDVARQRRCRSGRAATCPRDGAGLGPAADLAGAGLHDDAVTHSRGRRATPHAARVPVERLPHVSRLLGRVRRPAHARPPRRRAPRRRHQGRGRGERAHAARARAARPRGRDVERGLGALHGARLAVLRARRRRGRPRRRRRHRRVVGPGEEPPRPRDRRRGRVRRGPFGTGAAATEARIDLELLAQRHRSRRRRASTGAPTSSRRTRSG